jgi:hypothetical protein
MAAMVLAVAWAAPAAQAQFGFNFGNNIGGVRVDARGVLSLAPEQLDQAVQRQLAAEVQANNRLFTDNAGLRKLSLRQLNQVVAEAARQDQPVPTGNVVGQNTGLPALHLEDLLTALRTVESATTGAGISVSIEPSEQSRLAFRQVTAAAERSNQVNAALAAKLEETMGPQDVILTGVPKDSRFANVLALADYRMKRISMGLDASPLQQLPSFVSMLARSTTLKSLTPRFWMEMNYNPVRRSEDGKVWQVSGTGVKTLTENDFVNNRGQAAASGKQDPIASKWADAMTQHYGDLVNEDQIFAELRNIFDMSVIAALIEKEGLIAASGVQMETLVGTGEPVQMPKWNVPTQVPTAASLVKYRRGTIVTASGGVQLDPWSVVSQVEVAAELASLAGDFANHDGAKLVWN